MEIGHRIKQIRNEIDITQEAAASAIGVSKQTFIRYEKGKRNVPAEKILQISQMGNGYNPNWLLTGEGERFRGGPGSHPESKDGDRGMEALYRRIEQLEGRIDALNSAMLNMISLKSEDLVFLAEFRIAGKTTRDIALQTLRSGQDAPGELGTSGKSPPAESQHDQKVGKQDKPDQDT